MVDLAATLSLRGITEAGDAIVIGAMKRHAEVNRPPVVRNRVWYRGLEEQKRQIVKRPVNLHELAHYMGAYEVADGLISKFEALIVRAFANDLLNVRMENF